MAAPAAGTNHRPPARPCRGRGQPRRARSRPNGRRATPYRRTRRFHLREPPKLLGGDATVASCPRHQGPFLNQEEPLCPVPLSSQTQQNAPKTSNFIEFYKVAL